MSRLRALAGRLRPRSRKGAVGLAISGVALVAVAVIGVGIVLPWAYGMYGFHPEENARSWAALTPQYAQSPACQRCHAQEYEPWQAAEHSVVACESCHGPLAEHAATAPQGATAALPSQVEPPHADLCVLCHEQAPGRPAGFPVVELATHYGGAPCMGCHEPHGVVATRPPHISHQIEGIPECIACHAPDALKPVPVGHEPAADAVCRQCHLLPAEEPPPLPSPSPQETTP